MTEHDGVPNRMRSAAAGRPDGGGEPPHHRRGRARRTALLAAALVLASGGAGVAAISNWAYTDAPALTDEELGGVRGGFTLPNLPGLKFSFAARVETRLSRAAGPELALLTELSFDEPTATSVTTTRTVDGVPQEPTTETVDLTRQSVTRTLGDPDEAFVLHEIGRKGFATLMQNLAQGTEIENTTAIDLTVDGVSTLQQRLPSRGVTSAMDTMRHALTQSLR